MQPHPLEPPRDRFASMDLIRGVAVCGILVMNIIAFAMPTAAYLNPYAYFGDRPSNHLVFGLTHIFADQKFMGIFSLLFGGSAALLIDRLRARSAGVKRYYYARNLWLMGFGLLHGLFLWEGDILLFYGFCALFLYPFYYLRSATQAILGLLTFLGAIWIDSSGQQYLSQLPQHALERLQHTWLPADYQIQSEKALSLGSYSEQLAYRLEGGPPGSATETVAQIYLVQGLLRAFGMMLLGMALFRRGFLTAARGGLFYRRLFWVSLLTGVALAAFGLWRNYTMDWDIRYGLFAGLRYNHLATPLLVVAYAAGLMWLQHGGGLRYLRGGLAAVGRMAFSNYIAQSVFGILLFRGQGLGLFGQLDRSQLLLVVVGIWIVQFQFSLWWLRRFRYGPLEWLWRVLTYQRLPSNTLSRSSE